MTATYTATLPPLPSHEGRAVALDDILAARDARAARQQTMQAACGVLFSLTLAAPGAVKRSPLLDAVFQAEQQAVENTIPTPQAVNIHIDDCGHHALYRVDGDAYEWKHAMLALEAASPLARLWDIDIIAANGRPISRAACDLPPRRCLLCDDDAKNCARARRHSIDDLNADIARRYRLHQQAEHIGAAMRQALITEATLTPKAGLVDASSNGGHHDMTLAHFLASADAIAPYLAACAACGMTFAADAASPAILAAIRPIGIQAEAAMLAATGGVNTHKGAIFAFGLTAAALGKNLAASGSATLTQTLADIRAISADLVAEQGAGDSAGQRAYRQHHITGARGAAADGYRLITAHALPAYQCILNAGGSERHALLAALVTLYATNDDTTTIARVGLDGLRTHQEWAKRLLADETTLMDENRLSAAIAAYDYDCTARRLSAGGSADLLALVAYFGRYFPTSPPAAQATEARPAVQTADNPNGIPATTLMHNPKGTA